MSGYTQAHIRDFLNAVSEWASQNSDLQAVALVGSYARGAATAASDIDLILLTRTPERYLDDTAWVGHFGEVERLQVEDYGPVTSVRAWYRGGPEVEYGIAGLAWVSQPLDEGTRQVLSGGTVVLYEREALLTPILRIIKRYRIRAKCYRQT